MKKVIVTGATGFIGKFLVRELVNQEIETIAVVREGTKNLDNIALLPVRIIYCNISDLNTLSQLILDRDIDTVFHTAWQGVSDIDARNQAIQIQNLQSTLDLLDIMQEMKIGTFVGAGSIHEAEAVLEMAENKVISNMGYMYKASKVAAHWMGKAKAGSYGIRFFWPLINTYGEEEHSARLVNTIIRKIFNNIPPELSDGNQYYDFVHVTDVAKALCLIADKGVDGTNYVIGSGEAKPLKEFLTIVGKISNELNGNTNIPLGFGKITNNVISLPKDTFDVTLLKQDTGFEPLITFEEGVLRTAKWIMQNPAN
jgi:nucleoside-diphosphate-sugar epimerase